MGGNTAPPATAITRKDAASLVLCPSDLIANAKIVGNIIDIKKKTPYSAISETQPNSTDTMGKRMQTASEYSASIFAGLKNLIIELPEKRPIINNKKPSDKK